MEATAPALLREAFMARLMVKTRRVIHLALVRNYQPDLTVSPVTIPVIQISQVLFAPAHFALQAGLRAEQGIQKTALLDKLVKRGPPDKR